MSSSVSSSCLCDPNGSLDFSGWLSEFQPHPQKAKVLLHKAVHKVMSRSLWQWNDPRERLSTEETFSTRRLSIETLTCIFQRMKVRFEEAFSGVDSVGWHKKNVVELGEYLENLVYDDLGRERVSSESLEKHLCIRSSFNKEFFSLQKICENRIIEIQRSNLIGLFEKALLHGEPKLDSPSAVNETLERIVCAWERDFPPWVFQAFRIRAITKQKIQELVQERTSQMNELLQHFSFLWSQKISSGQLVPLRARLPAIMPYVSTCVYKMFRDIEPSHETVLSFFEQSCEKVLSVFQEERDFFGLQEKMIFHPEQRGPFLSECGQMSIDAIVESFFRSNKKVKLVAEVQSVFAQPGMSQQAAREEIERYLVRAFVFFKAKEFDTVLQREPQRGNPIPLSSTYPCLFPDREEHKAAFQCFCEESRHEIEELLGGSFTTFSTTTLQQSIDRESHEAFNEIIRERARHRCS